ARHLAPGGVLLVEPWLTPETYHPGMPHARFVDLPDLKLARMNVSRVRGRLSPLDFAYLVATPRGIERFRERHVLALFTDAEYRDAFRRAGLAVDLQEFGDRGLYVGSRAQ